jgi:lysophospholipase L1-like esterase
MRRLFIIALLLLAGCGGGASSPSPVIIELNADSLMTGPTLAEPIPLALQRLMPDTVIVNKAVVGLTLGGLMEGYDRISPVHDPLPDGYRLPFAQVPREAKIVVLELGINDALQQSWRPEYTPESYERDLRAFISIVRSEGRIPVLTGLVPVPEQPGTWSKDSQDRIEALRQIVNRVAEETGTVHARFEDVPFAGMPDTVDGAHRTQEASNRLAEQLAKVLREILSKGY